MGLIKVTKHLLLAYSKIVVFSAKDVHFLLQKSASIKQRLTGYFPITSQFIVLIFGLIVDSHDFPTFGCCKTKRKVGQKGQKEKDTLRYCQHAAKDACRQLNFLVQQISGGIHHHSFNSQLMRTG